MRDIYYPFSRMQLRAGHFMQGKARGNLVGVGSVELVRLDLAKLPEEEMPVSMSTKVEVEWLRPQIVKMNFLVAML